MPEPNSPTKPSDSTTNKLLGKAPVVDLLTGIITTSILASNPFSSETNNNNNNNSNSKSSISNNNNEEKENGGMREKPPLSVPITTLNFKNFVSKSGPIFAAQDAVEAIICWQKPSKTIACACLWGWLSMYPKYLILIPNFCIIWILLTTHSLKFPRGMSHDFSSPADSHLTEDPIEGSPDYLSNLQNIQNMMGDVTKGIDFIKEQVVIYLDWSNPNISLTILQFTVFISILLALLAPFIPWKFVLFLTGQSVFFLNHPAVKVCIKQIKSSSSSTSSV